VPPQPTVVIAPAACRCACPRHHLNASRPSVAQSTSAAVAQQLKPRLQHGEDHDGDDCTHPTVTDERFLRRSDTAIAASRDGCRPRDAGSQTAARQGDDPTTRHVDAKRPVVRSAWTSECRRRRPQPDNEVDAPPDQPVTDHCRRDVRCTEKVVAGSPLKSSQDASGAASRRQTATADFATCTDQLTSDIYATLAAYRDLQENDVIDAVRGCLRSQPSPSSSRHRRPSTGRRRPLSAADGDGSRTVQLRQGDVGPLSSLVVISPATPRPRTSRGPATSNICRPRTAAETTTAVVGDRRRSSFHDRGPAQLDQSFVVQTSSQATTACKSQLINGDATWLSASDCQQ